MCWQILYIGSGQPAAGAGHPAVGSAVRDGANPAVSAQAARAAAAPAQGGVCRACADQGCAERRERRRVRAASPAPSPPPPPPAAAVARRADDRGGALGRGARGRRGVDGRPRPQRQHAYAESEREHRDRGAQLQGHARLDGQVAVRERRRRRSPPPTETPLGGQNVKTLARCRW